MDDESRVDIISQPPDQNEAGDSPRKARIQCISRIPDLLRNLKLEAYVPQVVSLGPFYFGNPQVAKGEKNKKWCEQYLPRSEDLPSFDKLVGDISSDRWMVGDISSDRWIVKIQQWYYGQGDGRPIDERLGPMMARDGLFLLRFLREVYSTRRGKSAYLRGHTDPFQPKSQIEEDIMKLENQIPFFVVNMVLQWESTTDKAFNSIVSRACKNLCPFQDMNFSHDPPLVTLDSHLLGFMYENIIRCSKEDSQKKKSSCTLRQAAYLYSKGVKFMYENIICSSKEEKVKDNQKKKSISTLEHAADFYSQKGVKFKAQVRPALNKICFNDKTRTFYLPAIKMDSKTDAVIRNLLAYEALVHEDSAKPLLCYIIDLMERLINEPGDVKVLKDGGIIEMHLSNNREVANVWNDMRKVLVQYEKKGGYKPIDTAVDGVATFCHSEYRIWCIEFKEKYFSRPWLVAALIAGCFSLLLSLLQTIIAWKQLKGM